ncbi:hypothetical protein EXIGLDRAFT_743948 [Exidia glandulosa HHB12029]|uniref:HMG box domain-containing protein n=1 Tax=Exidia glandulosa HHB12029 TaxID=1314781 RepID=A0A165QF51_EXIGL|nr:hypothetical protein EXIGLDRAFT_743948 [Exidia glandulosa HHB12029]
MPPSRNAPKEPKGMPFPDAPTGPLDDHEQRILDALAKKGNDKVKRPPNAFILFRSWAIQCHKDGRALDFVSSETNRTFHDRGAAHVSIAWKEMSNEGKAHWAWRSRILSNAHYELFPDYQYRPVHKPKAEKEAKRQKDREERVRKGLPAEAPSKKSKKSKSKSASPSVASPYFDGELDLCADEAPLSALPYSLTPNSYFDFQPIASTSTSTIAAHPAGLLFSQDGPTVPSYRVFGNRHRRASSVLADNTVFEQQPVPLNPHHDSLELDQIPNISRAFHPIPRPLSAPVFENVPLDAFSQAVMSASAAETSSMQAPVFTNPFASQQSDSEGSIFTNPFASSDSDSASQTSTFAPSPADYAPSPSTYIAPAMPAAHEDKYPLDMQSQPLSYGALGLVDGPGMQHIGFDQLHLPMPQGVAYQAQTDSEMMHTLSSLNFEGLESYMSSGPDSQSSSVVPSPLTANTLGLELAASSPASFDEFDFTSY